MIGEASRAAPEVLALIGQTLDGRYRIDDILARGGMAYVFRGQHLQLQRPIAVKVLDPERTSELRARFITEAENAAVLDHPNCIHIYDYGTTDAGLQYMVMPLLQGRSLVDVLSHEAQAPMAVLPLAIQLFRGIEHAHAHGVIHRDLKPENLFLADEADGSRVLKIVDFGIAKKLYGDDASPINATMSGLLAGTPGYMSPEQALGLDTDERSDLYSAGLILYRLLLGSFPFEDADPVVTLQRQLVESVPAVPADVPRGLAAIVDCLLAREREHRFATATDVIEALEAFGVNGMSGEWPVLRTRSSDMTPGVTARNSAIFSDAPAAPATRDSGKMRRAIAGAAIVVGLVVGAGALALAWPETAVPGSASSVSGDVRTESIPVREERGNVEAPVPDALRMLAMINDPRPDRALGYAERRDIRDKLRALGRERQIDERLNLALDLLQAQDAPEPCPTFKAALAEIDRHDDEYFAPVLAKAVVPSTPGDPECVGLTSATQAAQEAPEPEPEARPSRSSRTRRERRSHHRRTRASHREAPSPPPAEPVAAAPEKLSKLDKIDKADKPKPAAGRDEAVDVAKLEDGIRPLH